jgi:hypothetical protein
MEISHSTVFSSEFIRKVGTADLGLLITKEIDQ